MSNSTDWKLEDSKYDIKFTKSEIPYFRNSVLQNTPLDSREIIQEYKNIKVCDAYGNLTERGRVATIRYLKLEEQCMILNIKLNYEPVNINNETEISTLRFYEENGYKGTTSVLQLITDILYSICFDKLYPLHIKKYEDKETTDSYSGSFLCFMEYFKRLKFDLVDLIKISDEKIVMENFKKILKIDNFFYNNLRKSGNISEDIIIRSYRCIGNEDISKIGMLFFLNDPYIYTTGWPDLIITKNNKVKFIEVKRKDKLKVSQIITISDLKKSTNLDISVLKII